MSEVIHHGAQTVCQDIKGRVAIVTGAGAIGDGIGNGRKPCVREG